MHTFFHFHAITHTKKGFLRHHAHETHFTHHALRTKAGSPNHAFFSFSRSHATKSNKFTHSLTHTLPPSTISNHLQFFLNKALCRPTWKISRNLAELSQKLIYCFNLDISVYAMLKILSDADVSGTCAFHTTTQPHNHTSFRAIYRLGIHRTTPMKQLQMLQKSERFN